ncbi:MAG: sulfite exporter TauE/SafE [Oceanicoccus sp.]|jgi:sulfite exporter TauE/SafE
MIVVTEMTILGAFIIGFLGSSHCLGMCGGLTVALGIGGSESNRAYLLSYNAGRILTYGAIGGVAGFFGEQIVSSLPQAGLLLRALAGALLIAMGLYINQWWMGLTQLEKIGARLWKRIQPLSKFLIPVKTHRQALQLGSLWGLLPCGLVYSTLSWALATAQWQQSALFMIAFGVGTLPAMLSVGFLSQNLLSRLRDKRVRVYAGLTIILMGIITIIVPWKHARGDQQKHGHHSANLHVVVAPIGINQ